MTEVSNCDASGGGAFSAGRHRFMLETTKRCIRARCAATDDPTHLIPDL
jgi:hypothetical protein